MNTYSMYSDITKWRDLENTMLNEMSQTQKDSLLGGEDPSCPSQEG
jgi:hypothetical protein